MKKTAILLGVAAFITFTSCERLHVTTLTIDGAVIYYETDAKIKNGYAVFLVAKADIEYYDRNAIPEITPPPPDTAADIPQMVLPSFLTPQRDAQIIVNNTTIKEEYAGQYQGELNINPGDSVFLNVYTQDGDTGMAKMVMPGAFNLDLGDTVIEHDSLSSLEISWSRSENANAYMVLLYSVDTATQEVTLDIKTTTEDTTYTITQDKLSPGTYLLQVSSIYGRINASMPQAGTLVGILGQVATLYVKKPVLIEVR